MQKEIKMNFPVQNVKQWVEKWAVSAKKEAGEKGKEKDALCAMIDDVVTMVGVAAGVMVIKGGEK